MSDSFISNYFQSSNNTNIYIKISKTGTLQLESSDIFYIAFVYAYQRSGDNITPVFIITSELPSLDQETNFGNNTSLPVTFNYAPASHKITASFGYSDMIIRIIALYSKL